MEPKIKKQGEIMPHYISPLDRDHSTYYDSIGAFNRVLQGRLAKLLDMTVPYSGSFAFTTTGSDGRMEKGPESKVELLVLKAGDPLAIDAINSVTRTITEKPLVDAVDRVEVKDLERDVLSYYQNEPRKVYPTRIIDIQFLSGNPGLVGAARARLYAELTGELGNRIREYTGNARRIAKNVMKNGKEKFRGETVVHIDMDEGIAHYGPVLGQNDVTRGSFKYGPLRFVQYAFADAFIRYLNSSGRPELLGMLPTNMVDRFLTLESEGLTKLTPPEIKDIVDSYKFMLWLFHTSQFMFKERGEQTIGFDKKEVVERIATLERLLGNGIFK